MIMSDDIIMALPLMVLVLVAAGAGASAGAGAGACTGADSNDIICHPLL